MEMLYETCASQQVKENWCMCVQENKQENPEKEKPFTPML